MKGQAKIVWAEGIFLGQQHLQQWEASFEACQHLQTRRFHPLVWGLISLSMEEKSLANGRFQLRECTAVFSDGRLLGHGADEPPLLCDLQGRGERVEVYLAMPANADVEGISGYPRKGLCAWRADYHQIPDLYDPQREREVLVARANLRLLCGEDSRDSFFTLKIAEVIRESDGSYRLQESFIPPVTCLGLSPRLRTFIGRLVETIGARMRQLRGKVGQSAGGPAEFVQRQPADFLLLQTLGGVWPQLLHLQVNPELPPAALYALCCRLAGELAAFFPDIDPQQAIPAYRHDQLGEVFAELEQLFGILLQLRLPCRSTALRLTRESESLLSAERLDPQELRQATFFLEVFVDLDDPGWITDFVRQVKVCSRQAIDLVVSSALPGVRLLHTQRPPAKLAVKSGHEYFRLEARGDFWNRILEAEDLAVFLPQSFAGASVELVSVQE